MSNAEGVFKHNHPADAQRPTLAPPLASAQRPSARRGVFIMLALLVFISSCKMGKEYQRPELTMPEQFNGVSFADTSSIADVEWKLFFTDTTLQALIEKGLTYNYDLLIAMNRIDIAQQYVKQAKWWGPDVNFHAGARYDLPSKNSLAGLSTSGFLGQDHLENYNLGVTLSWEIDIWGKLRNQREASRSEYLGSYEGAKAVQTQLVASIANGYFNLLMLDKQLEIAQKNLVLSDSFLIATRLLRDAGIGNSLAVQQAAAQRQTTAMLVPQLEQAVALQENALQILTGSLPGTIERSAILADIVISDTLSTGIPAALVSRRPDVRSAEMSLVAMNARVGIAKANMYPALNITAGGGLESFTASNWFNLPSSLFGWAAGTIAQPLLNRRQLKTEFEVSKLKREEGVIRFRQSVLNAVGEVSNALVRVEKLGEEEEMAQSQVATLDSASNNARLLFRSDMATYLEVVTAQGAALRAELNLAAIQRERLGAKVELYRALGGGWK